MACFVVFVIVFLGIMCDSFVVVFSPILRVIQKVRTNEILWPDG